MNNGSLVEAGSVEEAVFGGWRLTLPYLMVNYLIDWKGLRLLGIKVNKGVKSLSFYLSVIHLMAYSLQNLPTWGNWIL